MAITTGGCMKSWPCTHCPRSLCRWHPARRAPLPHPAALPLSRSPLCHQPVLRCRSTHFGSVQRDSQLMGNLHIPADLRNHCPLFQTKCDILQTWNMRSLGSCCFHAGVMMMVVSWWFHGGFMVILGILSLHPGPLPRARRGSARRPSFAHRSCRSAGPSARWAAAAGSRPREAESNGSWEMTMGYYP